MPTCRTVQISSRSDIGGADVSNIFERRFLVQGLPGGADDAADDDNLICIKDQDIATAFAIEAMRRTDHYNFRSVREPDIGPPNQKPKALDDTGTWVKQILRSGMTLGVWKGRYWRERFVTRSGSHRWVNPTGEYRQGRSVLDYLPSERCYDRGDR